MKVTKVLYFPLHDEGTLHLLKVLKDFKEGLSWFGCSLSIGGNDDGPPNAPIQCIHLTRKIK